jgi:2-polyprenyl-3-methyl-5-hydroxy-6-metoxy-1,4-benzoquinol methylase
VTADWRGLATTRPETIASLTLVCPTGLDATPLGALTSRVLVLTGDQGTPAEAISKAMPAHPEASIITLNDYYGHPRADLLTDRAEDIGAAMLAFLARMDQLHAVKPVRLPAQEGELDGISYRIQGAGAPLVLLPLGLAASQWEPLLPRLSAQYCTLTLGGAILGSVASLEARGRSTGYLGVVRNLIAEIHLHPGETILDVGCGSGVLDRWLARHTGGAHRITAVDIHRTLLREAAALATKEGLAEHIEFREGNAEVLPFGDNSFDVTMSATVMELLDAERMLREMVRVTRPGGRVGVVVRAIDMQSFVNVPVRAELKMKIAALPNGLAGARGCADGSLYQRFRNAGLQDVQMLPQLATYAGARAHAADERIEAALSPAELAEWHTAVTQAEAEGTFFIALPFHCAVGTVPLAGRP